MHAKTVLLRNHKKILNSKKVSKTSWTPKDWLSKALSRAKQILVLPSTILPWLTAISPPSTIKIPTSSSRAFRRCRGTTSPMLLLQEGQPFLQRTSRNSRCRTSQSSSIKACRSHLSKRSRRPRNRCQSDLTAFLRFAKQLKYFLGLGE